MDADQSRKMKIRIGAAVLAVLIVGIVLYLRSGSGYSRTDPNIDAESDVIVEGTVTCNGRLVPGGYVIAWQGAPVAFADVQSDGTYRMVNAPLGKCIITYSSLPPVSVALRLERDDMHQPGKPLKNMTGAGSKQKERKSNPGISSKGTTKDGQNNKSSAKDGNTSGKGKDGDSGAKGSPPNKDGGNTAKGSPPSKEGSDGMPPAEGASLDIPELMRFPPTGPPFGENSNPGRREQHLSQVDKTWIQSIATKYGDATQKLHELETVKGSNTFNLSLSIP